MMNKLLLFLALLSFSNLFSQQPYGIQRGQRGYIPPPKFESSWELMILLKIKIVEFLELG